jgi:DNA-binding NarL/FixJ family response regulator
VFVAGSLTLWLTGDTAQPAQALVDRAILLLGWFVAAGVGGTVNRHRQAYLEQAEQGAAAGERTREESALRRAGEERLRIARELHDSITHSISVIEVQAGVAIHLARKRGEEVPDALLAIQEVTEREREVTALAAQGLSNDEIAAHLMISPATAKTHISRAMTKLHARDRAQLVVFAYQSGLVAPQDTQPRRGSRWSGRQGCALRTGSAGRWRGARS